MRWGLLFRAQQYLKNSLWVVPFLGGVVGVLLAQVGLWLDTLGFLSAWTYSPETATAVVSATISAVASLTGFVVTVTVLGVQMATGTFSPRYMRMWYRDGRLKLLLAVLVGTLMFSFFVMRQIQPESVPDLSVSLTNGGVALALLLFVLYFDRFVHRMRPVAVAAYMADEGRRAFEEWLEDASRPDTAFLASGTWQPATEPVSVVRATRSGTIQALHMPGLTRFARDHACTLVFRHGVGDFVPVGATLIEVHGTQQSVSGAHRLAGMVSMGVERTIEQDPAFAIRVMVDVATRALSPAVNDPSTAVQILDHLGATLRMIGTAEMPSAPAASGPESAGVVLPVRVWGDYLSLGVTEIREYGGDSVQVVRRLRALLEQLADLVLPENRPAVEDELRRLEATAAAAFGDRIDQDLARGTDSQGIGGPARHHVETAAR